MKNEDIHIGFTEKEVRDFLAQGLEDAQKGRGGVSVEYLEEQIEKLQTYLRYAKKYEAICQIIADKYWEDWDVSEEVLCQENYFSFIGTEEEYNKLIEAIKKEKQYERNNI